MLSMRDDEAPPPIAVGRTRIYYHRVHWSEALDWGVMIAAIGITAGVCSAVMWMRFGFVIGIVSILLSLVYTLWSVVYPTPWQSEYWES